MLKLFREWVGWRFAVMFLAAVPFAVLFFFLYIWRLGTLVPGFSPHEAAAINNVSGSGKFSAIKIDPINAPHKLLQFIFQHFGHHGAFWMRSVSVFFALIFILALFLLLKKWFGNFLALAGTLLLATTPWVIIAARSAAADIMFLSPVLLIFAFWTLTQTKNWRTLAWFGMIFCLALCVYTPGLFWFIAIAFVFGYRHIMNALEQVSFSTAVAGYIMFVLLLTPLAYGFYLHPALLKDWLLIPHSFPSAVGLAKNFGWSLATLAYQTRQHLDYNVGRLAILNIAQSVLALVGLYGMRKGAKREMFALLILFLLGLAAASLNNNAFLLTLCLPAIAVFDAAALRFLYLKWLKVFPLNPIPRAFAAILIFLLITLSAAYGLRYSLAAWPHNMETSKLYVLK